MLIQAPAPAIAFPHETPPDTGQVTEIAPGILWVRLALPFLLNHVNVYLVQDRNGWAALDTGLGVDSAKAAWDAVFSGPLHGQVLTRVICSHHHPDHFGLVGWLTERFDCPLAITREEFLMTLALKNSGFAANVHFYAERGMAVDEGDKLAGEGHGYLRLVTGVPPQFHRLVAGESLRIGGRDFSILTGGGHSPEQAMLFCRSENVFFAFDQVMTRISPNISVHAMEPEANPLGQYLASLAALRRDIPSDALVLPGHHLPFTGLHVRVGELESHHAIRCGLLEDACRAAPRTAFELIPVLFKRQMDYHQTGFAFSETLAHVNHMRRQGRLVQTRDKDGVLRLRTI